MRVVFAPEVEDLHKLIKVLFSLSLEIFILSNT